MPVIDESIMVFMPAFCKETATIANTSTSVGTVWEVITSENAPLAYTGLLPINSAARGLKTLQSTLTGGNLSSLHYWSSTYGPLKHKHIIIIETEDDATRMDSILTSLKLGPFFENTEAIIFGAMHDKSPKDKDFEEIQARCDLLIQRFAENLDIPVFTTKAQRQKSTDLLFGHGEHNDPVPLGTPVQLSVDKAGQGLLEISTDFGDRIKPF